MVGLDRGCPTVHRLSPAKSMSIALHSILWSLNTLAAAGAARRPRVCRGGRACCRTCLHTSPSLGGVYARPQLMAFSSCSSGGSSRRGASRRRRGSGAAASSPGPPGGAAGPIDQRAGSESESRRLDRDCRLAIRVGAGTRDAIRVCFQSLGGGWGGGVQAAVRIPSPGTQASAATDSDQVSEDRGRR